MSINTQEFQDLSTAINSGNEDGVRNIVTASPELLTNKGMYDIFCQAVIKNDVEKARLLIEIAGMKLEPFRIFFHEHPMIFCARSCDPKFVEMLVKNGEDIEAPGIPSTALLSAALHGKTETVKKLLELGANVEAIDGSGRSLFEVATLRSLDTLKTLHEKLPHKLDETSRKNHKTPLSFALSTPGARLDCVLYLLEHSTTLSSIELPLHMVAWNQYIPDAIPALIEAGKKIGLTVDTPDDFGVTALMEACHADSERDKRIESVKKLTECGANINIADNTGKTALMYAAEYTKSLLSEKFSQVNRDLVKFLLDHNADVLAQDKEGKTAIDYCQDPDCIQILAEASQKKTEELTKERIEKIRTEGLSAPQKGFPKMVIIRKNKTI